MILTLKCIYGNIFKVNAKKSSFIFIIILSVAYKSSLSIYPLAPQSITAHILWQKTLSEIHTKRWDYDQKWADTTWDPAEIDILFLKNHFDDVIRQLPMEREAFQAARREIAWWMGIALAAGRWKNQEMHQTLYNTMQQTLEKLESRIPVHQNISSEQIEFTPRGVWNPFMLFGSMDRWIKRSILENDFIQKSLWLLTDSSAPIQSVMIYPYRSGNYKITYKLHVVFADGHYELYILKWIRSYSRLLLKTKTPLLILQEKAASLLVSNPDDPRLPTVGIWNAQALVIEQMMPMDRKYEIFSPEASDASSASFASETSILEKLVDIHLQMDNYSQPFHLAIGDPAFQNYFPLDLNAQNSWGRIDFGSMPLTNHTARFINNLINSYIDQAIEPASSDQVKGLYERIEVAIIKILLKKGKAHYVEKYLADFDKEVQQAQNSNPALLHPSITKRIENIRNLLAAYKISISPEQQALSLQQAA